jgi:hypothetical protein
MTLGFAAAYPLTGGSRAATRASTTVPNPDPPPTTTQKPDRPPPPPPPLPPAPPPPPPAQTYVAPPPPPAVAVNPPQPPAKRRHRKHQRAAAKPMVHTQKPGAKAPKPQPRRVENPLRSAVFEPTDASSTRLPNSLALLVGIGLGLVLIFVAAAHLPARAMGHPVFDRLLTHREDLMVAATALSFGMLISLIVVAFV